MPVQPSKGKLLYHLTHIDNIMSILSCGLKPRQMLESKLFKDIADPDIIEGRKSKGVGLENYVPFHFFALNPFDGAVCKIHGSENMAIIAISRSMGEKEGKIIPKHPLSCSDDELYDYSDGFEEIDWNILDNFEKRDYKIPEIKRACMAECLIKRIISPKEFSCIYVSTDYAKSKIEKMRGAETIQINVAPGMFPSN